MKRVRLDTVLICTLIGLGLGLRVGHHLWASEPEAERAAPDCPEPVRAAPSTPPPRGPRRGQRARKKGPRA